MAVILRNNAAFAAQRSVTQSQLGRGGSGRGPLGLRHSAPAKERWRRPDDPAAELMPAAEFLGYEPDFRAIIEEYEGSPFDPSRRRVLGKLMGVFAVDYQSARTEERRFLRRILAARNAREGYAANRALHLCQVPHAIRRTLALGVAEARFEQGPARGFLGAVQARVAATTFRLLGPASRERVWNALVRAGTDGRGRTRFGADRVLERALVLKALGARRHLVGPWSREGERAIAAIEGFADAIRGASRACLAARTTLFPGDVARVAGVLRHAAATERAALIARSDLDPVFAWTQHDAAAEYAEPPPGEKRKRTAAAPEEALPDLDRGSVGLRVRLHQALALARAVGNTPLDDEAILAVTQYIGGQSLSDTRAQSKDMALQRMTSRGFDVVGHEAIEAIHEDAKGTYKFDAAVALGDLLSRYTGATYVRRLFSDQLTAGGDPAGQIKLALQSGLVVPLTLRDAAQRALRALAVLGERAMYQADGFDMQDPATGERWDVPAKVLLAPQLPDVFGRRARADAYMAPAPLDLLAPPFGLVFRALGVEDRL